MPRTSTRQLSSLLRLLGIDEAAIGPSVSSDIQLTYQLDNLAELIAPIPPVRGFATTTVNAAVGRVSGVEILPPPDAAVEVEWIRNDEAALNSIYEIGTLRRLTDDIVATAFDFTTGGTPRSIVQQGSRAISAAGLILNAGLNLNVRHPPLLVVPGQVFIWLGLVVNTAFTLSFAIREVPVP